MNQDRQGDLLFVEIPTVEARELRKRAKEIARGEIVLAYGEVTGHRHAVHEPKARLLEVDGGRILVSPVPIKVVHEEHAPAALPSGTFRVIRQREYQPEQIRTITD